MSTRFHLRFDGGARDGELVPVPRSGLLVGRRQGNDLRLDAASVSGRHALLRQDGDLLRLEDMGSTNGTRVDGEKVETAALRHAQRVVFGDVPFEVVDASAVPSLEQTAATPSPAVAEEAPSVGFDLEDEIELGSSEPAPRATDDSPAAEDLTSRTQVLGESSGSPASASMPAKRIPSELVEAPSADDFAPDPAFAEEAVHTVDDALLERTRSSSAALPIVVGLLVLGGAAAAWFLLLRGDAETGGAPVSAALVRDGNLLQDGDLEGESEAFLQTLEGSIELFGETWAASSGALGLGGELLPGDRLLAHTADVAVRAGQEWEAVADLRADAGLAVALGLELFATDGSRSVLAWSAPSPAADAWDALRVESRVRPGFDRARLWIAAGPFDGPEGAAAELALDDLGLVPGTEDSEATVEMGAFELALWRPDRRGLALYHAFAPLFTIRTGDGDAPARPGGRMSLDTGGTHPRVELSGAPGPLWLELRPQLGDGAAPAIATQGADGFRQRSGGFESNGVDALVIGAGATQTRLAFDAPAVVKTLGGAGTQRIRIDLDGASGFVVQTDFSSELAAAVELTSRARSAERDGRAGDALAHWGELRARYPFQPEYLREAELRRAALLAEGLDGLRTLEEELERARFFALPGVYARCEQRASALAERFSPTEPGATESEVAVQVQALLVSIRAERAALGVEDSALEPERRERILGWVERNGAARLAERLRDDG